MGPTLSSLQPSRGRPSLSTGSSTTVYWWALRMVRFTTQTTSCNEEGGGVVMNVGVAHDKGAGSGLFT